MSYIAKINRRVFAIVLVLTSVLVLSTNSSRADKWDDLNEQYSIFISKGYTRPLVTQFLTSFTGPQCDLAIECGTSQGTLSKLKNPQKYSPIDGSARKVWGVIEKGVFFLKEAFDLDIKGAGRIVKDLLTIDLSKENIISDDIGEEVEITSGKRLSSVVEELRVMDGTFTSLILSNSILTDDGIDGLVEFLLTQSQLTRLECRSSGLGDEGIQKFIKLVDQSKLPHLEILDISGNYGPGRDLIRSDVETLTSELRVKLKI